MSLISQHFPLFQHPFFRFLARFRREFYRSFHTFGHIHILSRPSRIFAQIFRFISKFIHFRTLFADIDFSDIHILFRNFRRPRAILADIAHPSSTSYLAFYHFSELRIIFANILRFFSKISLSLLFSPKSPNICEHFRFFPVFTSSRHLRAFREHFPSFPKFIPYFSSQAYFIFGLHFPQPRRRLRVYSRFFRALFRASHDWGQS